MNMQPFDMAYLAAAGAHGEPGAGLLEQFGVNWQNLLAQIVVFLAVFYILKRFAFGPILAQLEERRERIREQQENAAKIKSELAEAEEIDGGLHAQCIGVIVECELTIVVHGDTSPAIHGTEAGSPRRSPRHARRTLCQIYRWKDAHVNRRIENQNISAEKQPIHILPSSWREGKRKILKKTVFLAGYRFF